MGQERHVRVRTHDNRWMGLQGIVMALVLCVGCLVTSGTALAQTDQRSRPDELPRYYDPENVFPENQRAVLVSDADRLAPTEIPILVYVRTASVDDAMEEQAQAFADTVRTEWNIATEPNADDGMVILLSWVPDQKDQSSIVISWGEHTFDENGLTPDYVSFVNRTTIQPFLDGGYPFEAMYGGMRKIRYGGIYFPPPVPPLTNTQHAIHQGINVLGPVAVISVPIVFVSLSVKKRFGASASRREIHKVTMAVFLLVSFLFTFAILGRSEIGIASALLILVSLAIQVWLWTHPPRQRRSSREPLVPMRSRRMTKRAQYRTRPVTGLRQGSS